MLLRLPDNCGVYPTLRDDFMDERIWSSLQDEQKYLVPGYMEIGNCTWHEITLAILASLSQLGSRARRFTALQHPSQTSS
jgi:hypothetical protein